MPITEDNNHPLTVLLVKSDANSNTMKALKNTTRKLITSMMCQVLVLPLPYLLIMASPITSPTPQQIKGYGLANQPMMAKI